MYNQCMLSLRSFWSFFSLFFVIGIVPSVFAGFPIETRCRKPILKVVKNWQGQGSWQRRVGGLFAMPTSNFGEWILLSEDKKGITIVKASHQKQIRLLFSKRKCKRYLRVARNPKSKPALLRDKELKKMMGQKRGLIYLWSPNMPLSVRGIKQIEKAARDLKLKLIVIMDEKARRVAHLDIEQKYQVQASSFELKMRNAYLHFPTLLAFDKGVIKNKIKYGYENTSGYKNNIKDIWGL